MKRDELNDMGMTINVGAARKKKMPAQTA